MSDSDSEIFELNNISGSEDESDFAPAAKKTKASTAKAPAAKAPKKVAAAPKASTSAKPKAVRKKQPLASIDENIQLDVVNDDDSDDMGSSEGENAKPKKSAAPGRVKKSASDMYQQLTPIEHILVRPDSYIGSIETVTEKLWVFDSDTKRMVYRDVKYVPGFFKIIDEILVNAADNKINDPNMDTLKVTIDTETNQISVWNNGKGIPIEIHSKTKLFIPDMIFGHLLTSSNYNDDEKKLTGGRNGYGAKLTNIYSTQFTVETADKNTGQKYKQTWTGNMGTKGAHKITKTAKGEEFTHISFKPDLARFGMESIDADTEALLKKRVYDMAGTVTDIKVLLNGERIKVKNFESYCKMYLESVSQEAAENAGGAAVEKKSLIFQSISDRWEVGFALSDSGNFQQVSFANSIATIKGGTHVKCMSDQISKALLAHIEKKNKAAKVKPAQTLNHMWIFVRALIENPTFDSQTKETLTLLPSKFGGQKPVLSEAFIKKVLASPIVEQILNWAKFKATGELAKSDGKKRGRLNGMTKLSDANNAGGRGASKCTLILTEGDSAKALAEAGLSVVGRDNFGVFPLRGKLLNVRDAPHETMMKNTEIANIKKIMGLQSNMKYADVSSLRYGSLMIMTDQDHDGSHIKGLLINFIDHFFPSLLKIPGFLVEFVTPIVRARKGKQSVDFFTLPEFEKWNEENNQDGKWTVKYFKGLGTSNDNDAMEYFSNTAKHVIPFAPVKDEDRDLIDMAFSKKRVEDRKDWLRNFKPGTYIDHAVDEIPISTFVNDELICFSVADNMRSIPSVVDGLKPGQRKIVFGCFKKKMKAEMKVAQLIGYISEKTAYHHGEQSLAQTIIGMAQTFVGSNNINLLSPNGQFGTRATGGADHASPRYIFTLPTPLSRSIFHPDDERLLKYQEEDGDSIEPEWYMPVIPMVLVNGTSGIGTGYSTDIPNYNPADIVANIRRLLHDEPMEPMTPWYRGFKGTIEKTGSGKYLVKGMVNMLDKETVEITELPVGLWTQNYKEMLEKWIVGVDGGPPLVKDYKEHHTNTTVHFVVTMTADGMAKAEADPEGLVKFFKCQKPLATTNMMAFDSNLKLRKYVSPEDILEDFFPLRLAFYQKRKDFLCNELQNQWEKLSNQARFVQMIIDKKLVVSKKKKAALVEELRQLEFRPFGKVAQAKAAGEDEPTVEDEEVEEATKGVSNVYDYLLSMPIWSLTEEKVAKLLRERDVKEAELNVLLEVKPSAIWDRDLEKLVDEFEKLLEGDNATRQKALKGRKAAQTLKTRKSLTKGKKKKAASDSEEDDFKPAAKAARPKVQKAKVPAVQPKTAAAKAFLDDNDEDEKPVIKPSAKAKGKAKANEDDDEVDWDEPPLVTKKSTATKPAAKKPALPGSDSDVVMETAPAKGKAKATLKRKSPTPEVEEDEDKDGADDVRDKTAKKAKTLPGKQSSLADFFEAGGAKAKPTTVGGKAGSSKPTARKVSATKAKPKVESDDEEDEKPVVKKKPAPQKKKVPSSDAEEDDEIEEIEEAPKRGGPRRAATTAPKTYNDAFELTSGDEDPESDGFNGFDDD